MGENDTHLLELLSLSLVLDVTPSASQQERDSDSEHTPDRSHAAQHSNAPGARHSSQPSQATGDLPRSGYQLGGTAPTLNLATSEPGYLVLVHGASKSAKSLPLHHKPSILWQLPLHLNTKN